MTDHPPSEPTRALAEANEGLRARLTAFFADRPDDEARCAICGWPLAESLDKGCVRGNCSSRPFPQRWYAPERAKREYGPELHEPTLSPLTFSLSADEARLVVEALSALAAPRATTPRTRTFAWTSCAEHLHSRHEPDSCESCHRRANGGIIENG